MHLKKEAMKKRETVDIILPSRIGDCVMTIPAIICLKQLTDKFPDRLLDVGIFSANQLTEVIKALDLFEVRQFGLFSKIKSIINPSDKAVFLHTTTKNYGFRAKKTYGINIKCKRIKYDTDMPYLYVVETRNYMSEKLFDYLKEKYDFSTLTVSFFGICTELGFSCEEIIENFDFNQNSVDLKKELTDRKTGLESKDYFVFCMEAAYGSKNDTDRRWKENNYFETAERIYNEHKIEAVFIGIENSVKLPNKPYMHDFRKKLSLEETCLLFKRSKGYIGNDTGPLHIANLMKKPSIGIYFREASLKDYTPIFKNLNHPLFKPDNINIVSDEVRKILYTVLQK